jgi:DnaK suppressor protein
MTLFLAHQRRRRRVANYDKRTAMTKESMSARVDASVRPVPPHDLSESLAKIEDARARQLASLPTSKIDPVSAAYRGSLERILDDVRTARQRLIAGLYGVCARCQGTIPGARLELRLWATTCTECDAHRA